MPTLYIVLHCVPGHRRSSYVTSYFCNDFRRHASQPMIVPVLVCDPFRVMCAAVLLCTGLCLDRVVDGVSDCDIACVSSLARDPQRPPCIANDDNMTTSEFIKAQTNGIQVDMRNEPASYIAPNLHDVRQPLPHHARATTTHSAPTTLPATTASTPPTTRNTTGATQITRQFCGCIATA